MRSDKSADDVVDCWQVTEVMTAAGKPETVEAFFVEKLGNSAGKRTFKEFVAFVKDKVRANDGEPAVFLTGKGGRIVGIRET